MTTLANLLGYLTDLFAALLGTILLLRSWSYAQAIPTSDPLVRFCQKLTDWLVMPIQRSFRRSLGKWHWPSLIAAFGIAILSSFFSRVFFSLPFSAESLVVSPFALLIRWGTELVLWGTVFWAVLSWFKIPSPLTQTLGYLLSPILRPVRKVIPTFKGFDLSPVAVFILCQLILILVTPIARGFV